mmetsp:Transcript_29506/g.70200  ORF Transcript_29506/g.70200 Transcript_29506/m.70200 type:complete len:227 (-) Transcript_29506:248-928(-)
MGGACAAPRVLKLIIPKLIPKPRRPVCLLQGKTWPPRHCFRSLKRAPHLHVPLSFGKLLEVLGRAVDQLGKASARCPLHQLRSSLAMIHSPSSSRKCWAYQAVSAAWMRLRPLASGRGAGSECPACQAGLAHHPKPPWLLPGDCDLKSYFLCDAHEERSALSPAECPRSTQSTRRQRQGPAICFPTSLRRSPGRGLRSGWLAAKLDEQRSLQSREASAGERTVRPS